MRVGKAMKKTYQGKQDEMHDWNIGGQIVQQDRKGARGGPFPVYLSPMPITWCEILTSQGKVGIVDSRAGSRVKRGRLCPWAQTLRACPVITKTNILMQYFLKIKMNAKKVHEEENIQILNKDQCCAKSYWRQWQEEKFAPKICFTYILKVNFSQNV